ncbi:MAG: DUF3775 domain-containing protein [Woeseiaceae bacterium]|nr:DUF3775 domain-containing protein [Woeseiaceae bacterium]
MTELDLNRDTVQSLIDKAHEFQAGLEVTFPDASEGGDEQWAKEVAASFAGDPFYTEFKAMVEDLDPDQQWTLVSLMWLGRGDYSVEDWDDALKYAEQTWTDHTADYLIGTSLLADYLQGGLDAIATSP